MLYSNKVREKVGMKKVVNLIAGGLLILTLAVGVGVSLHANSAKEAQAIGNYSTDASTYYNGITATSGKQLAAQLHDLITSTHRYYTSYDDNGKNLYQQQTDQYYDANGNKVNGYIYEFYSGAKWSNSWVPTTTGGYNREHCWCQSLSVPANLSPSVESNRLWGETGGGSDMHHLRPVEKDLNSTRNNHPYGELSSNRNDYKVYPKLSNGSYSTSLGGYMNGSEDIFEPIDEKKGDVARIILYTYLHYNTYAIADLFGSYGTTNGNGSSSYFTTTSSGKLSLTRVIKTSTNTEAKALELLLKWNANDPVDAIEQRRNEQVAKYQGNRNPFIDNSAYADAIWGTSQTKTLSSISVSGQTTSFTVGDTFSFGGTVTAHYSDLTTADVTSSTSFSGYNMNNAGNQTVTASYVEGGVTRTTTYTITVNSSGGGGGGDTETYYQKITSMNDIENGGKYVIVGYKSSTTQYYAMPAYSSGNNIQGVTVTLSENNTKLTQANMSTAAVYTLTSTGTANQYYIGTGGNYLYAAGTDTNNHLKAKSTTDSSAGAFTISYTTFFSVVAASSNRNTMRFNASNNPPIFSCYASNDTQTEVMFFKEVASSTPAVPESISATPNKTFYVGEKITKSDITVTDNLNNVITDFSFANNNYQFKYTDAPSGGLSVEKTFTNSITYSTFTCSLTVNVQREAYIEPDDEEYSRNDFSAITGSSYSPSNSNTFTLGEVTMAVTKSYKFTKNSVSYLSLLTQKNDDNKYYCDETITASTKFATPIKEINYELFNNSGNLVPTIEFSPDDSDDSWTTENDGSMYRFKIRFEGSWSGGYINFANIEVVLYGAETPLNLANYVMYEDDPGQCEDKFDTAEACFNKLSKSDKATFMTSDDYVLDQASDRLVDWAKYHKKQIVLESGEYVIKQIRPIRIFDTQDGEDNTVMLIVIISALSLSAVAGYFFLKKKKYQ